MKKYLLGAMALAVAVPVIAIPMQDTAHANADSDFRVGAVTGGIEILSYEGTSMDVVIPATIGGKPVVHIYNLAFQNKQITSLIIPEGVKSIGSGSFRNNKLTKVVIPYSMVSVEWEAFANNILTEFIVKNGDTTFDDATLKRNYSGVTIKSLDPSNAKNLGYSFELLTADDLAEYNNGPEHATTEEYFNVTSVTDGVKITGYTGTSKKVTIPSTIGGKDVVSIGEASFIWKGITSVDIPEGVTNIGKNAFYGNALTHVKVPSSVTTVEMQAFSNNKLTSVDILEGVNTLGTNAFSNNKITSVEIPKSVKILGNGVFKINSLTSLKLHNTLEAIGTGAFRENQLTSVDIPEGLKSIPTQAFTRNQLTSIKLPESLTSIGADAFTINQIENVTLPKGLIKLDARAFKSNNLTKVVIPESLLSIGADAFASNQLTSVTLPEGLTKIEGSAFKTNKLTKVNIPETTTSIGTNSFEDNELAEVVFKNSSTVIGKNAFLNNQVNPSSLIIKGYNPSTAKVLADTDFHTFKTITAEDLKDPVPPTEPTEVINWSFGNTESPYIGGKPRVTVIGGKPTGDIFLEDFDWVTGMTTVATTEGDIVLNPTGDGNTLMSVPNGLGTSTTSTTLKVEHEGQHFITIIIKPKPVINFTIK